MPSGVYKRTKPSYIRTDEIRAKISKSNTGKKRSLENREKMRIRMLGKEPANKGKKMTEEQVEKMRKIKIGVKLSQEHKKILSASKGGSNDIVGTKKYKRVHYWVYKQLGKPKICEICNDNTKSRYEWSNISQTYKYELSDWQRLCTSCHIKYDISCKTGKSYE